MFERKPLTATDVDDSVVEGMMGGYWTAEKRVEVSSDYFAECIDGTLWKICYEPTEDVVGFINPTNCVSSAELEEAIHSLF